MRPLNKSCDDCVHDGCCDYYCGGAYWFRNNPTTSVGGDPFDRPDSPLWPKHTINAQRVTPDGVPIANGGAK